MSFDGSTFEYNLLNDAYVLLLTFRERFHCETESKFFLHQLVFILLSFVCGMFLSFVYDIFRILRSLRGNVYFKGSLSNNFFSELNFFDGYNAIRKKLLLLNEKSKASFLLFFFEDI